MPRKAIIYFFLLLMVFNTTGHYLVFELNRFLVRRQMSALITSGSSFKVQKIVSSDHIRMVRFIGMNEIEFEGKMFDIVYQSVTGNVTTYYGINDSREDKINAGLEKVMKGLAKYLLLPFFTGFALPGNTQESFFAQSRDIPYKPCVQKQPVSLAFAPDNPPENSCI